MDRHQLLRMPEASDEVDRAVGVPVRPDPAGVGRVPERADVVLTVWTVKGRHAAESSDPVGRIYAIRTGVTLNQRDETLLGETDWLNCILA